MNYYYAWAIDELLFHSILIWTQRNWIRLEIWIFVYSDIEKLKLSNNWFMIKRYGYESETNKYNWYAVLNICIYSINWNGNRIQIFFRFTQMKWEIEEENNRMNKIFTCRELFDVICDLCCKQQRREQKGFYWLCTALNNKTTLIRIKWWRSNGKKEPNSNEEVLLSGLTVVTDV